MVQLMYSRILKWRRKLRKLV